VYGDFEMSRRLIPSILINSIRNESVNLSSPECIRDFIYVEDVVDFYLKLAEKRPQHDFVFNIGTGVQSNIQNVVEIVQRIIGKRLDIRWGTQISRPWEPKVWQACIEKAKKVLEWQPKYSLEHGLQKALEWFKRNLNLYEQREKHVTKNTASKYKSSQA
jgi:nucleoside-diphosphate-sugar epimerase